MAAATTVLMRKSPCVAGEAPREPPAAIPGPELRAPAILAPSIRSGKPVAGTLARRTQGEPPHGSRPSRSRRLLAMSLVATIVRAMAESGGEAGGGIRGGVGADRRARLRRQFVRGSGCRQVADRFRKAHPHSCEPEHVGPALRIVHALRKRQAFPGFGAVSVDRVHGASTRMVHRPIPKF